VVEDRRMQPPQCFVAGIDVDELLVFWFVVFGFVVVLLLGLGFERQARVDGSQQHPVLGSTMRTMGCSPPSTTVRGSLRHRRACGG
jgi:hypothetical protein